MSNKLTDDTITALYQQGATQTPSPELDQAILQQAATELNSATTEQHADKPFRLLSRSWFAPVSAVASMICVALLYWQNTPVFHQVPQVVNNDVSKELPQASKRSAQPPQPDAEQTEAANITLETLQLDAPSRSIDEPLMLIKEQALRPASNVQARQGAQSPTVDVLSLSSDDAQSLAEVDALLAQNKPIQAVERLKALLKDAPYLKAHLSAQQKQLLNDAKRP